MRRSIFRFIAAALGLAITVFAPGGASALTQTEIAMLKGAERQKVLEEGARKEGKVTFYSAMIVNQGLRPIVKAFMEEYPYIQTDFWRGSSRKILTKVLAEMRAGALVADVMEGAGLAMPAVQADAVVPFYSPSLARHEKAFYDEEGRYASSRVGYYGLIYNTKLVSANEAPSTYDDLLNPKWKGKIAWRAQSQSGSVLFIVNQLLDRGEKKGVDYLEAFAKQDVVNFSNSARQLVDRVGQGEYPIAVNIGVHLPVAPIENGAPLAEKFLEPVPSTGNSIVLVKGAPHPHAALLLIDYVLSREGQEVLAKAEYFTPHMDVEPVARLKAVVPDRSKVEVKIISDAAQAEYQDKAVDLYNRLFR